MKKVLIFENEYPYVQAAFEYVRDIYFEGQIEYTVLANSQDLKPFSKIEEFDYVFVDISLGQYSSMDGFGILKKIESDNLEVKTVVILTGNHLIEQVLIERGIKNSYPILSKPIDFKDLLRLFR
ncbi:response regulator [Bacteroides sp. 214]|uniref:hypothetical protein n=1 Tax=Bacteroides sp. 214 TaxID=2302935 RepID=UPI0013D7CE1B|nr:hypothetical protein [Bacteroides sp. 214]NDW11831.1 response regulator [Bacteroides sp. 214]